MLIISPELPLLALARVVNGYGVIGNNGYTLVVHGDDEESEKWIATTLDILGFPPERKEDDGNTGEVIALDCQPRGRHQDHVGST